PAQHQSQQIGKNGASHVFQPRAARGCTWSLPHQSDRAATIVHVPLARALIHMSIATCDLRHQAIMASGLRLLLTALTEQFEEDTPMPATIPATSEYREARIQSDLQRGSLKAVEGVLQRVDYRNRQLKLVT